ncbi:MAG: porin family protein [Bacteroidota bacterium]
MKRIIIIPFILLVSGFVSAQTFQFGPKAGVNISNFSSGNYENNTLVGFHLGGFLSFALGKSFAIQPEVLFSTQGAKIDDVNSSIKEFKTNYLNIPILAQIRMPGGLYLETGPQAGILLTAKTDDESVKDLYENLDWSWAFGLGFRSKMGLGLGARYNLGLNKVKNSDNTTTIEPNGKNSVIQVSLFFAIGPH